jgi:hypothetical protein
MAAGTTKTETTIMRTIRLYQRGLSHGQDDASHNRARQYRMRRGNDFDRRAYESGYDQGYQSNYRGDRSDQDNQRHDYERENGYGHQQGYQQGYNGPR